MAADGNRRRVDPLAQINLARRAQIGREKRQRTRAQLLEAARRALAGSGAAGLTVDAIAAQAGVAKGTFYVHFPDLPALEAELGAQLVEALDERLQPARLAIADPLERFAVAAAIMLGDLARAPDQARLAARAMAAIPLVGSMIHQRLQQDISAAALAGGLCVAPPHLAVTLVSGMIIQTVAELAQGRLQQAQIGTVMAAILRAIAASPADADGLAAIAMRRAAEFAQRGPDADQNIKG